jgi:hypothetical protein
MTVYLFDEAYAPNLDAVKANSGIAMSVYLTGNYAGTCAQPGALLAAGLGVLGNYEQAADELLTAGHAGGVSVGQRAAAAYIGKGAPSGTGLGIAFSVDVNAPPSSFPAIGQAFDGIIQGLAGRFVALCYGEGALIDYLVQTGRVPPVNWLSASSSYPGWNPDAADVALVQQFGTNVPGTDEDKITNTAIYRYIWWPAWATPSGGGTLILGADDIAAVASAVWNQSFEASQGVGPAPAWAWVRDGRVVAGAAYNIATVAAQQATAAAAGAAAANTALTGVAGQETTEAGTLAALQKAVAALSAPPSVTVDVAALAAQLAANLGPALTRELVGALGAAITKGNN